MNNSVSDIRVSFYAEYGDIYTRSWRNSKNHPEKKGLAFLADQQQRQSHTGTERKKKKRERENFFF